MYTYMLRSCVEQSKISNAITVAVNTHSNESSVRHVGKTGRYEDTLLTRREMETPYHYNKAKQKEEAGKFYSGLRSWRSHPCSCSTVSSLVNRAQYSAIRAVVLSLTVSTK